MEKEITALSRILEESAVEVWSAVWPQTFVGRAGYLSIAIVAAGIAAPWFVGRLLRLGRFLRMLYLHFVVRISD